MVRTKGTPRKKRTDSRKKKGLLVPPKNMLVNGYKQRRGQRQIPPAGVAPAQNNAAEKEESMVASPEN